MSNALFLSFWSVSLRNFPVGSFSHRKISSDDARQLIQEAQGNNSFQCVSDKDIFALYGKKHLEKFKQLQEVLQSHCAIDIELSDVVLSFPGEEDKGSIFPLSLVEINQHRRLLVVDCSYSIDLLEKKDGFPLVGSVVPESVKFHLFESLATE